MPYDMPIDLSDTRLNNALMLHRLACPGHKRFAHEDLAEPSPCAVAQGSTYYRVGGISPSNKNITAQTQREIIGWVIGTHKSVKSGRLASVGEDRRKLWKAWAMGDAEGRIYQTRHLPWIVSKYTSFWGLEVNARILPLDTLPL